MVGQIETSKVFRSIPTTQLGDDFFGRQAIDEVQKAFHAPPPKNAEAILRLTEEEIGKGFTGASASANGGPSTDFCFTSGQRASQ